MPPYFTIITAVRNGAATLPRLLASLAEQTYRDFEWVAQDGASTDDTLAVIEAWRDKLPSVSVESAPDTGIYDAWNKALDRIQGQWVLFLGADDLLAKVDVLERLKGTMQSLNPNVRFVNGGILLFEENSSATQRLHVNIPWAFARRHYMRMPFAHPALLTARDVFEKHRFDPAFRIAGDYDWVLRAWTREYEAVSLDFVVTRMARGGVSDTLLNACRMHNELRTVFYRHYSLKWQELPMIALLLCESYLYRYKLALKIFLSSSALGQHVWNQLHAVRKYILRY